MWQKYMISNMVFTLHIWDTAGQEKFRAVSTAYYRGAQACILAFDVTDRSSFDGEGGGIRGWLDEVRKENQVSHFCTFLVGLKCDLKDHRQVQMSEGIALAKEIGAEYWEVSSKEDINVKELFDRVAVQSFEQSLERAASVSADTASGILGAPVEGTKVNLNEPPAAADGSQDASSC